MSDLISRKALLKKATMHGHCLRPLVTAYHMCVDVKDIETAPAVDAVEVVHSTWKLNNDGSGTCMNCHRHTKNVWDYDSHMKYCPECGAKMDGERRSE